MVRTPKDARHDWEIYRGLATRMASRLGMPVQRRLSLRAQLAATPAMAVGALLATGRKVSMRKLRAKPEGVDLGPLRPTMPGRLQTPGRRIQLAPDLLVADLDRLRASLSDLTSPANGELLLIGRRHRQDCNSWLHNTRRLTRGRPRHQLLMNPADLADRGIVDGSCVRVASRVGTVDVGVTASEDLMPGVVSLPHGYGHQVPGIRLGVASLVQGVSINDLTDPERLDVSGNAALNGVPVTVAAV